MWPSRDSVVGILPQLTKLSYWAVNGHDSAVQSMIRASNADQLSLRELTVHTIDDGLVGALLDKCPDMARIEVQTVGVTSDEYKGRVWGLRELVVGCPGHYKKANVTLQKDMAVLAKLALLPRPTVSSYRRRERMRIGWPRYRSVVFSVGTTAVSHALA